jgi:hypothetical protein
MALLQSAQPLTRLNLQAMAAKVRSETEHCPTQTGFIYAECVS